MDERSGAQILSTADNLRRLGEAYPWVLEEFATHLYRGNSDRRCRVCRLAALAAKVYAENERLNEVAGLVLELKASWDRPRSEPRLTPEEKLLLAIAAKLALSPANS